MTLTVVAIFAIGWRRHARLGVLVTAATLALAALWLYLLA